MKPISASPLPESKLSGETHRSPRAVVYFVAAAWMAVIFDRMVVHSVFTSDSEGAVYCAIGLFWLVIFATVLALFWRTMVRVRSRYAVFLGSAFLGLVIWLIWDGIANAGTAIGDVYTSTSNGAYAFTTIPVMLMLSMLFANQALKNPSVYSPARIVADLLRGWFVKPFNRVVRLERLRDSFPKGSSVPLRIAIGVGASGVLLAVLVPLLMSADQIFSEAVSTVFSMEKFASFVPHFLLVVMMTPLLFSILWNFGEQAHEATNGEGSSAILSTTATALHGDTLVAAIVLCVLNGVYALFCTIQFTFLFAGEGLPADYTYSEYARQGFWQLLAATAINLIVFGIVVTYASRTRLVRALQCILVALTGVILASACLRLSLYIGAYGLTWLRLAAFAAICYLAILLVLCVVRVFTAKLPLVAVGFAVGLVIYIVFGFMNPDALILSYNLSHGMAV